MRRRGAIVAVAVLAATVGCVPEVPVPPTPVVDRVAPRVVPRGATVTATLEGVGLADVAGIEVGTGLAVTAVTPVGSTEVRFTVSDVGRDPLLPPSDVVAVTRSGRRSAPCTECLSIGGTTVSTDPASVESVTGALGETQHVVLAADAFAERPERGDVVTIGVGPQTPDAVFGKVSEVVDDGGRLSLTLVPASFTDISPSGSISLDDAPLPPGVGGAAAVRVFDLGPPVSHQINSLLSCGVSGGIDLKGSITTKVSNPIFDVDWVDESPTIKRVDLGATFTTDATLEASIGSAATCTAGPVDLLPAPVVGAMFPLPTPFGPVMVQPRFTLKAGANVSVSSAWKTSIGDHIVDSPRLTWDEGVVTKGWAHDKTFTATAPVGSASGSLSVSVTAELQLLVAGLAGPALDISGGLALSASSSAPQCWKLDGTISGGGQLVFPLIGFSFGEPKLANLVVPIAANTDPACTATTTTTTPGGPTTTTPGGPTTTTLPSWWPPEVPPPAEGCSWVVWGGGTGLQVDCPSAGYSDIYGSAEVCREFGQPSPYLVSPGISGSPARISRIVANPNPELAPSVCVELSGHYEFVENGGGRPLVSLWSPAVGTPPSGGDPLYSVAFANPIIWF